ncbi:MAG: PAS domain-containing protein, partial [Anaerolineae bacterium]|nr:PAS domain-containing protein [Anaerolineae bacterium]
MFDQWLDQRQNQLIDDYTALRQQWGDPRPEEAIRGTIELVMLLLIQSLRGEADWAEGMKTFIRQALSSGQTSPMSTIEAMHSLHLVIRRRLDKETLQHPEWGETIDDYVLTASRSVITALENNLKQHEQELREAAEYQRLILETTPMAILITRIADGTILYANKELGYILDQDVETLIGQPIPNFYYNPERDRPFVLEAVQRHGYLNNHQLQARRPDGSPFWVLISVHPFKYSHADALITSLFDITEHRQATEALRTSETQYRATIDALGDMIYVVDADLKFVLYNAEVRRRLELLGMTGEIIGRDLFDVFPFLPDEARDEYRQVFASGKAIITQEVMGLASGRVYTETHKIPIVENINGTPQVSQVITIARDITAQKAAEAEREQWQQELIEAQKQAIQELSTPIIPVMDRIIVLPLI